MQHCYTQCPQPCSGPLPTHAFVGDSWTLMGKSRTVSCGVTAPFSSVLVYRRFVCVLQESVSQSCVSSGSSMAGLMTTSSKRAYAIPRSAVPRALSLQQSTADRTSSRNTQTQFWLSLCGVSGSWWAQGLFEPSEHLWQLWGLFLNMISPLLPSSGASPLPLEMYLFLVGSNILLSTAVQQQVVILEFLQEKMSAHPATLPCVTLCHTLS